MVRRINQLLVCHIGISIGISKCKRESNAKKGFKIQAPRRKKGRFEDCFITIKNRLLFETMCAHKSISIEDSLHYNCVDKQMDEVPVAAFQKKHVEMKELMGNPTQQDRFK